MKSLLKYFRGLRFACVLAPAFKLTEALLELFVPVLVARMIDTGIYGGGGAPYIVKQSLLMLALGAAGLLLAVTAQYFSAKAATGFTNRIRSAAFRNVQTWSYSQLDSFGIPSMITRLTGDADRIQSGVNLTLRLLLRSPFVVFGSVIAALTIDRQSSLVFFGTVPVLAVIVFGVMLVSIRLYGKVQTYLDRITKSAEDNLSGARVIRAFRAEKREADAFAENASALAKIQKFTGRITSLLTPGTYIVINAATVLLIWVGALRVDGGRLTQGEVVALYNYMAKILVELIKLADLIITITRALASAKRVAALIDAKGEDDAGGADTLVPVPGAPLFEFRGVGLTYRGAAEPALEDISFTAERGERIGVIGGTGSGKSSLVSLIPRFYQNDTGGILYSGVPAEELSVAAVRSRIGVVPQHTALFSGTVRDNVRWGKPDATDDEICASLAAAQALSFVEEKDGGLDFIIRENGANLSGGQKQRLSIARALVKRPDVLILDDSSSALDYATDLKLRQALASLDYAPCVVTVSQRTVAVRECDKILVLDDGKLVGAGTHEELLRNNEIYREIHLSQYPEEAAKQ
ncbi:MAG: ABC transporter ATP-binding protein [Clostridia bacterium]|nr:ABC transporter ATP-binding protein [Clostridia bacterium]